MLTVRLIGFFSAFRKYNLKSRAGALLSAKSGWARLCFLPALAACLLLPLCQAVAAAVTDDEPGRPYIGRDTGGNRVFGTDDKSGAGFVTDPQTGDRTFRTAPPKKQDQTWEGPRNILVVPEVAPGRPPG